jgi:hypothetical protein
MIPMMNIIAWSHRAPWPEMRQIEQDRPAAVPHCW